MHDLLWLISHPTRLRIDYEVDDINGPFDNGRGRILAEIVAVNSAGITCIVTGHGHETCHSLHDETAAISHFDHRRLETRAHFLGAAAGIANRQAKGELALADPHDLAAESESHMISDRCISLDADHRLSKRSPDSVSIVQGVTLLSVPLQ